MPFPHAPKAINRPSIAPVRRVQRMGAADNISVRRRSSTPTMVVMRLPPKGRNFATSQIGTAASPANGRKQDSAIAMRMGRSSTTALRSNVSAAWPCRRHGMTYGFARLKTATYRLPVGTRADESSIGIIPDGVRCATERNMNTCSSSDDRCPRFAGASRRTWRVRACRVKRLSRLLCGCSNGRWLE